MAFSPRLSRQAVPLPKPGTSSRLKQSTTVVDARPFPIEPIEGTILSNLSNCLAGPEPSQSMPGACSAIPLLRVQRAPTPLCGGVPSESCGAAAAFSPDPLCGPRGSRPGDCWPRALGKRTLLPQLRRRRVNIQPGSGLVPPSGRSSPRAVPRSARPPGSRLPHLPFRTSVVCCSRAEASPLRLCLTRQPQQAFLNSGRHGSVLF